MNGVPLIPDDINENFDAIIGRKQPNHWRWQAPSRGCVEVNVVFDVSANFGGDIWHASGANAYLGGVPVQGLTVGDRITNIGIKLQGTGAAGTSHLYLMVSDGVGGHAPVETLDIVDPPGTWQTYTKALAAPRVVASGEAFYWTAHLALLNTFASNVGYAKDRL